MDSRAYQFQLLAAKAAAAEAPPVHAADDDEPEPPTPKTLLPELEAQGNGVAPVGAGNAETTKCPECPKRFASEKAMFGHLRKHPERGYKGATRPAKVSAAAAVAGDKKLKTKQVARKEADVSAMNMTASAATAGEKKPWEAEAELSTKWPVTAKRGRAPFAPSDERALEAGMQASSCSDEEAAMILLELASSSHSTSETQQVSVQQVHVPDAVSGHQMPDAEQPMLLDHVAEHQTPEAEQIVQPEIVLELSAESQTPVVKEPTNLESTTEAALIVVPADKPIVPTHSSVSGTKKAKKRRVQDLEQTAASPAPPEGTDGNPPVRRIPSPASDKKHECSICVKSFPNYQALGGHMSSHVKGKASARHDDLAVAQAMHNISAHRNHSGGNFFTTSYGAGACGSNFITASAGGWAGAGQGLHLLDVQPPAPMTAAQGAAPHVCAECHMTFPTGQALGGHKRKHWFLEKHQAKTAPAEPAPAPAPAVRDFDLNELPEEGEGESDHP